MLTLSCLVLALSWPGPGASPGAATAAPPLAELLREGFALYDRDQFEPAAVRFQEALGMATAAADPAAEAEARRGLGRTLFRRGQYPAAREELERARALFGSLGDRLGEARAASHLGSVVLLVGEPGKAAELYAHALAEFHALGALRDEAETRYNLLFVTDDVEEQGRLVEAGREEAAALGDAKLQGKFLQAAAEMEFDQGRFAPAAEKLEEASRLFEQAGARFDQARALNSLARLQRTHGQTERARELSAQALQIQEAIGDTQGMLQSLDHLADAESVLGHHRQALDLYARALRLAAETGSPRLAATIQGRAADAHLRAGEPARAAELLEGVLREGFDPEGGAMLYRQLARSYLGLKKYPEGLAAAEKAVELARQSGRIDRLLPCLFVRASARQGLGQREAALADAREGMAALERLRSELVPADFMKRGFAEAHQAAFGLTIELLAAEGRDREALEVAEQARARAFLDLLATREGSGPAPPAGATTPAGSPAPDPLPASVVAAPAPSADDVVETARRLGSALLSYFVGKDALFIWVVRPDQPVRAARVAVSSDRLWDLVRETRTALREAGARRSRGETALATRGGGVLLIGGRGTRAWRQLYDLLVLPVRQHLGTEPGSRLTIVPHGPLFLLSFAALLDERGRYLVEDYAVHYSPSAAVLQATGRKARAQAGAPARRLFLADPGVFPEDRGRPLPPLPGTRREVREGSGRLPPADTVILTGSQATKANFRRLAAGATLLHLATHGIVRDDEPLDSFLALSRGGIGEGDDDGRLTVRDIYGLDLQAGLVVLSACRTGLGQLSSDGMVGLTRAFFYAGTPSVVATLWDVADEPTFRLVSAFYARLGRDPDKALALRTAQLSMLRALRAGQVQVTTPFGPVVLPEHPALWAGFVLVGEP